MLIVAGSGTHDRVKRMRVPERDRTQVEAAAALGIKPNTLRRWLNEDEDFPKPPLKRRGKTMVWHYTDEWLARALLHLDEIEKRSR